MVYKQKEPRSATGDATHTDDGNLSTERVDKRHVCTQHSSSMEIQLAPSETKPFTRYDALSCVLYSCYNGSQYSVLSHVTLAI